MDIPYDRLPEPYRESLRAYLEEGALPDDSFLRSTIQNDLLRAVCEADRDTVTLADLRGIAQWLYHEAPAAALGSARAMHEWARAGGLRGHKARPPQPTHPMVGAARIG